MISETRRALCRGLATAALLVAAIFTVAMPAVAQNAAADGDEGGNVTLDVKDRPLLDVVNYIRDHTEVNIIVATDAEGEKVTISVKNLNWKKTLELVAEKAECILVQDGTDLIKVEKPPQVSFDFQDADVRKVISVIAAYSGANIVVGQEVVGTVTVRLNRVPWRNALDTVARTLGFIVVEDERSILRVTDPARLQEQLETRVYTFKYVRPPAPYMATIKTEVQVANLEAPGNDIEEEFNLLRAFRAAVYPEGTLEYIEASNSVVVTGTAPKLDRLEELISEVDIEPQMVAVDIQFAITRNQDFLEAGVDPGEDGLKISMNFGKMTHRLPFNLGDGGWEDSISAEGFLKEGSSPPDYKGTGPTPIDNGFSFGVLDFTGVQFALRLLKEETSARIVQAPKILTLDNQAATIFVGETIRYAQTTASSNQQGGLQFAIDEAGSSPVQTGFQLLVIPHVIPGQRKVMMTVIPQQQALSGTSTEHPGFNVFRGGDGASEVQIALPQTTSATVVTHMMLESGETAVIGGLLSDTESKFNRSVPFLSDIPLIGELFKIDSESTKKDHLIILITPHILRGADERRSMLNDEMRRAADRIRDEYEDIAGHEMGALSPEVKPEAETK
jgi:type IV pilus assembly protein PilQ